MTDYPGIDYGRGQANIDHETGIRYGVIRLRSLREYAIEDFEPDYGKPHCPKCGNEAETIPSHMESDPSGEGKWVSVVQDIPEEMEEWENGGTFGEYACRRCEYLFDGEEAFGDSPVCHTLDDDGYQATLNEYNDVFLTKSPFFTYAQFCSPCAPGAGHLDNPCPTGPRTYCFGHDWFDGGRAPYPVYSVETGEEVLAGE